MDINDFHEPETCRMQKSCIETNHQGAEMEGFCGLPIWCSADAFHKIENFVKKTKGFKKILNPESLIGPPIDSETKT